MTIWARARKLREKLAAGTMLSDEEAKFLAEMEIKARTAKPSTPIRSLWDLPVAERMWKADARNTERR